MSVDISSRNVLSERMEEDLLTFLKELRSLKITGELDDEESLANQETLWRNRLKYDVLLTCVKHYDEEIRLAALALLVESKKSTLSFSKAELDTITAFLVHNMRERLEYVPLIKKALKRIKESLAVLRRNIAKEKKLEECEQQVEDLQHDLYRKLRLESAQSAEDSKACVEVYKEFYKNLREMCVRGIGPGSTHSHKRSSLQMIDLGQELLDRQFEDLPWTKKQANRLFECLLLDTYETNKELIYKIAKNMEPSLLGLDNAERVREIIDVALDLGNCIRPNDSITASYMLKICLLSPVLHDVLASYENSGSFPEGTVDPMTLHLITILVHRLKGPMKLAEENIVNATRKHSLYGYLFSIRNLLSICDLGKVTKGNSEAWTKTIAEIIEISFRLNHVVCQVVNSSSPEGHLPMDSSGVLGANIAESDVSTVTSQMVLVCSWRTVKEVSLLFGHLSAKSPIAGESAKVGLLDGKQLVDIGEHLVTLLFETKHRGAFEQAHVGFGQLCARLWRLNQESLRKWPRVWLHHLLLAVSGLTPGNAKLCATRRSAGVPFMVQALVSSDPFIQTKPALSAFHSVMKILLGFTELEEDAEVSLKTKSILYADTIFSDFQNDSSSDVSSNNKVHISITEIKTHALNILRALFKHSLLGDLAKIYAADGLSAAIRSYDGKTWAERNAATLLYSALITRIFGVQRTKDHVNLTLHNKMTGRIFFERHPSLLPFMLNELQAYVDASDIPIKPSVQSILLLLSRLYPSLNCDDADSKWKIGEFIKLVSACAKSNVYKTRELAARALVPLLTEKTVHTFIVELFEKIVKGQAENTSLNALHGYMLQIIEIMKSPHFAMSELSLADTNKFLGGSRWIIENLGSHNDRPACFPLATTYITTLHEFVKAGWKIDDFDKIFDLLVPHLRSSKVLKQRPGLEIYELAVARLFVTVMEHRLLPEENCDESLESHVSTWNSMLTHSNIQVQIASWPGVSRVIEKTSNKKLMDVAMYVALNYVKEILDPDVQDSVYEFLYTVLIQSSEKVACFNLSSRILDCFTSYVVKTLLSNMENSCFQETPSFLRLLGKAYGKLDSSYKNESLTTDEKCSIYKTFLDNTWMNSTDAGCRVAISGILHNLFIESSRSIDDYSLSLDWWTSLLNLLVDDNTEARKQASLVVYRIEPSSRLSCIHRTMNECFDKFVQCTRDTPSVTFAGLFAWCMTLSGDADYEMDESDVFNKCYNYETFEPLRIAELCVEGMDRLLGYYSLNEELPPNVRNWLSERLTTVASDDFTNGRELVEVYGKSAPVVDDKLSSIIDPTHNDKLLQALEYKMLKAVIERH